MGSDLIPGGLPETNLCIAWKGDTSRWDARKQMREAMKVVRLLEAWDMRLHGKQTVKWVISGLGKDD